MNSVLHPVINHNQFAGSVIYCFREDDPLVEDGVNQVELELKVPNNEDFPLEVPFKSYGSHRKPRGHTTTDVAGTCSTDINTCT